MRHHDGIMHLSKKKNNPQNLTFRIFFIVIESVESFKNNRAILYYLFIF